MKRTLLLVFVGILLAGASAVGSLAAGQAPQGPEVPRVILQPASQEAPEFVEGLNAWSGDPSQPRPVGLERRFEHPWVVEFAPDRLPLDLPAQYAGGLLERDGDGSLVWTARLTVMEARDVRVHLRCFSLDAGCRIAAFPPGRAVRETVKPDMASAEGDLWTALVDGPTVLLRVEIPPGAPLQGRFEVAGILEIPRLTPPAARETPQPGPSPEGAARPEAVPVAPSSLTLTVVGPNAVLCQWQDNSTNETGFKIQRRTGTSGSYYKVGKVPTGVTAFTDPTCTPGQAYTYRVKAVNSQGASGPSNEVVVVAGLPGAFTLTGVAECNGSNPQNRLSWTASTSAATYDLYRNGALLVSGQTGLSYLDTQVTAGQAYAYQVTARNSWGSASSNVVGLTAPANCCVPPVGPTLTASTGCQGSVAQIVLAWAVSAGATSYDVYRNGLLFAPGQVATTYTDGTVSAGQGYNYYVVAKNLCGTGTSNTVVATAPTTCCPLPGNFTLVVQPYCYGSPIASGFLLQWTAASGVTASNPYDIYMDGYPIIYYALQTQAWFVSAAPNSLHSFFVRARNSCGSTDSNTASAIAPLTCLHEFIVDDLDTGHFSLYGPMAWWFPVTDSHCYANHMWYTPNETSVSFMNNYAHWAPPALAGSPGYYELSVYVPCLTYATTTHAEYYVMYGGVTVGATWVNQLAYCDAWAPLGTFYFHGDGYDFVELRSATWEPIGTTNVGFDAIRWRQ